MQVKKYTLREGCWIALGGKSNLGCVTREGDKRGPDDDNDDDGTRPTNLTEN